MDVAIVDVSLIAFVALIISLMVTPERRVVTAHTTTARTTTARATTAHAPAAAS